MFKLLSAQNLSKKEKETLKDSLRQMDFYFLKKRGMKGTANVLWRRKIGMN